MTAARGGACGYASTTALSDSAVTLEATTSMGADVTNAAVWEYYFLLNSFSVLLTS